MKKYFLSLTIIIACSCQIEELNAQGLIRLIETRYFEANETSEGVKKGKQLLEAPYGYSLKEFNKEGKIITSTSISESYERTEYTTIYGYVDSLLLEEIVLKDEEIETIYRYEYDPVGHLFQEKIWKEGQVTSVNNFKYNINGNQINACYKSLENIKIDSCDRKIECFYNSKDLKDECWFIEEEELYIERYQYNEQDLLVKVIKSSKKDVLSSEVYEYDEMENKVKVIKINGVNTETYTYDSLGNVLTYQQLDKNENLIIEEFTEHVYKGKSKTEKWKQLDNEGQVLAESLDVFDEYGSLIKHHELIDLGYRKIESLYIYEYQYDEKGNWQVIIEFNNGKPMLLTERKIEYF